MGSVAMKKGAPPKLLRILIAALAVCALAIGYFGSSASTATQQGDPSQIVDHVASSTVLPEYSGQYVIEVNGNQPGFSSDELSLPYGTERYSEFDELGRAGSAMAIVGKETMPTERRSQLSFKPTGWRQAFYQDEIGLDHLYERSHLLAHSLTAENDNPNNLITGTEYMNNLMIPYESEVARYVDRTGNHVAYRVSPIFVDDELVARGVQMEARSIEDGGSGVSFNIAIYNLQPRVEIDYSTGESSLA